MVELSYNCENGCKFIGVCLDIERLRVSEISGIVNEDLVDQYLELCSVDKKPQCLLAEKYEIELNNNLRARSSGRLTAREIELSGVSQEVFESIPKTNITEIRRIQNGSN